VSTPHGTVFYVDAAVGELGTVRPRAAQLRLLPGSWIAWPDPVCPAVGRRATKLEIERMVGDQGVRRLPTRPRRSSTMGNARMRDHSGAHGVELDVRATSEKISLAVDRCRPIASLPQRADSTVGGIDVSDVAPAEGLHRAWQAVFVARCHQQMRVVGDQHIGMDRAIIGRCGLREPGAGMMV
jgi:hypothetical protein